jgi:alpha-1,6-mannosyltransferase
VVGEAGVAAPGTPEGFAAGVRQIIERPEDERRAAARSRAELFGWPQAVEGFLRAHGVEAPAVPRPTRPNTSLRPAVPVGAALSPVTDRTEIRASRVWAARPGVDGADDASTPRYA